MSICQKDGSHFKVSSLKAIRVAIGRYLHQNPHNKPWSIVGDREFNKASETLNAVCKDMLKRGQVSPVVHKALITSKQLQKLYQSQKLGEATTTNPMRLLQTAWFYVPLYFDKCGRESQMLCLCQPPEGRQYCRLECSYKFIPNSDQRLQGHYCQGSG